ncbi:MAG: hypothetical protein K8R49_02870 [Candidatus Cloacimonetes bacterium]|nr:hypothetical protein [Candidatus Cloacimonadota bacterium]
MRYVIFDDNKWSNFFPITFTRCTGDLRVGILKLRQRIAGYFGFSENNIITSSFLEGIYKERHEDWKINDLTKEETLFINSRIKINKKIQKKIEKLPLNSCLINNNDVLAAKLIPAEKKISSEDISTLFEDLKKIEIDSVLLWEYTWELIKENPDYITRDFEDFFYEKDNFFDTEPGITIMNPYNIWIGEGTIIKPGAVIDATQGPVILDENARIMSNAVIIGPAYIGKNSIVKVGAKIYEGTSIGSVCKVGGEVEGTIFQAYSNKQHDGFLGHSYIGEWVNLGADTNNSDLKNNYKNVKVYFYPENKKIDSKSKFMGAIIGDHTKTAICSVINTGTVIGAGCNLFGRDIIKDFIHSFSWGEGADITEYKEEKFLETVEIVKQRRKLKLSKEEKKLFGNIRKLVID